MTSNYLKQRQLEKLGITSREPKEELTVKPEKKKGVNKVSDKRKVDQREYVKIVKAMLAENANCSIGSPDCTKKAEGLHHIVKRSAKNLLDKTNLIRSCNKCNLYLETHDAWAREQGFVKSRFK